MANAYTQLGFVKQADGENIGSWGDVLNEQLIDLLDDAIGGYVEVSVASGNVTLAFADGTADNNGRHAVIKFTGSPGTSRTITFPNKQKTYYIVNGSDDSVVCTAGTGAQTVTLLTGQKDIIYVDGSDEVHSILQEGAVSEKLISSQTAITSGIDSSNDQLLLRDASATALKKVSIANVFSSVGGLTDLSGDSSPQLGGDLDMNGNDIVTTSNANIDLLPNGTGKVIMDGNGSSGGVSVSDGLIDIRTGTGSVAKVKFYCESSNAHAQTLQAAPHSESASNTLTLPSTGGDAKLVSTSSTATLTNKTLTTPVIAEIDNSGDITLDAGSNIILDADGGGFEFKDGGTQILGITNSSGDVIIGPVVDAKDLIFQQRDGTEVARIEDNASFNISASGAFAINGTTVTSTAAELNILDGVTSTATELNIMDGDTSATSTTLADADRLVTNDAGTMKQVALTDLKTYLTSAGFSSEDPTALAIALG